MSDVRITDSIKYIGVNDRTLDLFESQYAVQNGVSYNSYVIMDDKVTVMDTVDARATSEWLANVENVLGDRKVDYLVISHLEPDHAASLRVLADKFPNMKLVGNVKTFKMLPQFFDIDLSHRCITVGEGETLSTGTHTLQFFMAAMVHWPEVMVTYDQSEKVLFSADAFGKFGALDSDEDWTCEARRYYFNIVGKYGAQVQALLKKVSKLDIAAICPLHGPILKEDLGFYLEKYNTWSSYEPEDDGVFVAYASIHGNTAMVAKKLAAILEEKGAKKVVVCELAREDMSEAVEDAFRYDKMVLAAASYDGGVFPCMDEFLHHLKGKNFQKRKIALVENGTWGPSAGKTMKEILSGMKDITICEKLVTIKSTLKVEDVPALEELADQLLGETVCG